MINMGTLYMNKGKLNPRNRDQKSKKIKSPIRTKLQDPKKWLRTAAFGTVLAVAGLGLTACSSFSTSHLRTTQIYMTAHNVYYGWIVGIKDIKIKPSIYDNRYGGMYMKYINSSNIDKYAGTTIGATSSKSNKNKIITNEETKATLAKIRPGYLITVSTTVEGRTKIVAIAQSTLVQFGYGEKVKVFVGSDNVARVIRRMPFGWDMIIRHNPSIQ